MSQSGSGPSTGNQPLQASPWLWSQSLQKHYRVDPETGEYVLPDGKRVRLPVSTSLPNRSPISSTSAYEYQGSPPGSGAAYLAQTQPQSFRADGLRPRGFGGGGQNDTGSLPFLTDRHVRTSSSQGASVLGTSPSASLLGTSPPTSALASLNLAAKNSSELSQSAGSSSQLGVPQISNGVRTNQVITRDGDEILETVDFQSKVTSRVSAGPPERITDPVLYKRGVRAHKKLWSSHRESEILDAAYKIRSSSFFKRGRVFLVLWAEPAGDSQKTLITATQELGIVAGRHGQKIYSKVRRFVVVVESSQYCSALPIVSYGNKGVAKNVVKSEHGIVYTGKTAPSPTSGEFPGPGEDGMLAIPIRVHPDDQTEKLHPLSRINYGKIYTVEHNVKVKPLGMINEGSLQDLIGQFQALWMKRLGMSATISSQSQSQAISRAQALHQRSIVEPMATSPASSGAYNLNARSGARQVTQSHFPARQRDKVAEHSSNADRHRAYKREIALKQSQRSTERGRDEDEEDNENASNDQEDEEESGQNQSGEEDAESDEDDAEEVDDPQEKNKGKDRQGRSNDDSDDDDSDDDDSDDDDSGDDDDNDGDDADDSGDDNQNAD